MTCNFNAINYDPTNPGAAFSPNKTDPNLKAPTTDEVIVGLEHQIVPELVAGVSYTYRKRKDFIENCPLALDNSAACISNSDYQLFNDGETGYDVNGNPVQTGPLYWVPNVPATYSFGTFQTNRPGYSTNYNGVELQLTKRLSNKWMAHASVSYNDWKNKVDNTSTGCVDPTNQLYPQGGFFPGNPLGPTCQNGSQVYQESLGSGGFTQVFIGSKWNFNITGLYQLPLNFNVAMNLYGRQGYRNPYFVQVDTDNGEGTRLALLDGTTRLKDVYNLDLRVEKVIPIASKASLTLSVDMFNVLNDNTVLQRESDATGANGAAAAGLIDEIQNPRALRFGARLSF